MTISNWRKSSHSGSDGTGLYECVEVGGAAGVVALRDSKNPGGGMLTLSRPAARRLFGAVTAR